MAKPKVQCGFEKLGLRNSWLFEKGFPPVFESTMSCNRLVRPLGCKGLEMSTFSSVVFRLWTTSLGFLNCNSQFAKISPFCLSRLGDSSKLATRNLTVPIGCEICCFVDISWQISAVNSGLIPVCAHCPECLRFDQSMNIFLLSIRTPIQNPLRNS